MLEREQICQVRIENSRQVIIHVEKQAMTFYFGSIAILSFAYDSRMFPELFGFLMDVSSCLVDDGVSPRIVERKVRMRFIFGQHALGDRYENLESRCVRLLIARCILVWLRRLLRTRKISVHINRPGKPFKRIAHWKICNRPIFLLFLLFIFIYFPLFIWNADERGVEWSGSFCVKRNEVVIDREAGWTKGSSINSWLVSSYIKNLERQNKINGFIVNLPCRIFSDVLVHTYVFYDSRFAYAMFFVKLTHIPFCLSISFKRHNVDILSFYYPTCQAIFLYFAGSKNFLGQVDTRRIVAELPGDERFTSADTQYDRKCFPIEALLILWHFHYTGCCDCSICGRWKSPRCASSMNIGREQSSRTDPVSVFIDQLRYQTANKKQTRCSPHPIGFFVDAFFTIFFYFLLIFPIIRSFE